MPVFIKYAASIKATIDQLVFIRLCKKYMKDVCNNKLMNMLNAFYQNFNVAVDIGVVHNIAF